MSNKKCVECGLVNFAADETCRRCGAMLDSVQTVEASDALPAKSRKRRILLRILFTPALIVIILLVAYLSLLATSDAIDSKQREAVNRAVDVLDRKGFSQEAFMLRHAVSFRATDNWWNRWVGHADAYAATNFPFEVVTLYPDFFNLPVDDVERAAILLHETYHLYGHGEEAAFKGAWRDKRRLGWTRSTYGETSVWKNVAESTYNYAPQYFQCGTDLRSDCYE
jgi:hypothetical protein